MSSARVVLLITIVSLASAGLLAWASRAPAEVRLREPAADATDPALGSGFSAADVERHAAYRGPSYLYFVLSNVVAIVALVLLAAGPLRRAVDRFEGLPGGWVTTVILATALLVIATWAASLPLAFVRGFAMDKAWGLSTQDLGGWISDQLRATGVAVVAGAVAATSFFATVRWQPRLWWAIGWAVFTALTIALTILFPIVIAPLFNRFTPLADPGLERRALSLAEEAGISVDRVLVADASRRTTTENAYVAGLGATKQLVLYDNLVAAGDEDAAAYVIAHELGHRVERHIVKGVVMASVGLLLGFLVLWGLARSPSLWESAGAAGVEDPRALPVLVLFMLLAGLVTMPFQNLVSRHFEARADEIAIELTEDPSTAVRTFRRLAFSNLADLRPHPIAVATLFGHPPIPARIDAVLNHHRISP